MDVSGLLSTSNVTDEETISPTHDHDNNEDIADCVYTVIFKYVAPVLIVFGTTGNILSLVVLQSKYFRKSPSAFILSALAMADTGVLLCGLLRHWIMQLSENAVDIRSFNIVTCYVHSLFTYYLPQLSSWSLVLLSLERLVSVKWPLKSREMFNKRKMGAAWTTIALLLVALNGHWFKTVGMLANDDDSGYHCDMLPRWYWFSQLIWPWLDLIVLSVIPVIAIFTCNILVIHALLNASKLRGQMSARISSKEHNSTSSQITAMLVGLNVIFFLTTIPVSIYFIGEDIFWDSAHTNTRIAYATCNIIYYLSNSTNFLVYCITGSKFRHALRAVICCQESREQLRRRSMVTRSTIKSSKKWSISNGSEPVTAISGIFMIGTI